MNRAAEKSRDFGFHYGRSGSSGLLHDKEVTAKEARAHLDQYRAVYGSQGWAANSPVAEAHRRADLRWARFMFLAQAAVGVLLLYGAILLLSLLVIALAPSKAHSQTVYFDSATYGVSATVQLPDTLPAGGTGLIQTYYQSKWFTAAYFTAAAAWQTYDPSGSNTSTTTGFLSAPYWDVTDTGSCPNLGESLGAGYAPQGAVRNDTNVVQVPAGLCGTVWLGFTLAAADRPVGTPDGPRMGNCRGYYAVWVPVVVTGCTPGGPTPGPTPIPTTGATTGGSVLLVASVPVPNPGPTRVTTQLGWAARSLTIDIYDSAMMKMQTKTMSPAPAGWSSISINPMPFHGNAFIMVTVTDGSRTEQRVLRAYF